MSSYLDIPSYSLDAASRTFRIDGYNWAAPFSNFLPGIAGPLGVPAWAYWVNRGQAVTGVGVGDRDGQILELYSFNKACSRVEIEGFRTFVRIDGGPLYEPFGRHHGPGVTQWLETTPWSLRIGETSEPLSLTTKVEYFILPGRRAAGLVRRVTLEDLSGRGREVEVLDGVPRILPRGIDQHGIKVTPRHIEAMFGSADHRGAAIFRMKQTSADESRVDAVSGWNFVTFAPTIPIVVDPTAVFGDQFDFKVPTAFANGGIAGVELSIQMGEGRTPCAFGLRSGRLDPGASMATTVVIGTVRSLSDLDDLVDDMRDLGFALAAGEESRRVVEAIADRAFTVSASPEFDAYAGQTFLDNMLRGGLPVQVAGGRTPGFSIYWRQNADLERDYHLFELEASYLSQGMGHYRSVLQNRRNDPWFFPQVEDEHIRTFVGLLQLDGYNPLEVGSVRYFVSPASASAWANGHLPDKACRAGFLDRVHEEAMAPGELILAAESAGFTVDGDWQGLLDALLVDAQVDEVGGLEAGFWIDHWHYNLDLIEGYLAVYPDRLTELLLDPVHTYFDNPDVVVPRSRRLVLDNGRIRQFGAVTRDIEKAAAIGARTDMQNRVRDQEGKVFRSSLLVKLLVIAATRIATLDPGGRGIEMEAGKPGWNDSLNGLPALMGSGLSETIELRRLLRLLLGWLEDFGDPPAETGLFEELVEFIDSLEALLESDPQPLEFWDSANTLKERYRGAVRLGVTGRTVTRPVSALRRFVGLARLRVDQALSGRWGEVHRDGVPLTYFTHEVTDWRVEGATVIPTVVEARPVEIFLEGPVHWIREFPEDAPAVHAAVRASRLYDAEQGMYVSSEPVAAEHFEYGRAIGAYPRGWLENESVYTHMEYKYLLALLESGLAAEYWADAPRALVPFLDPAVYGRSPLEGVSFIVSRAYPDPREHGRGYQPRLSGMTTEFLHQWMLAAVGRRPFRLDANGLLEFAVEPRLPGWMFTDEPRSVVHRMSDGSESALTVPAGAYACRVLGTVTLVLINPRRGDTFGPGGVRPVAYRLQDRAGTVMTVTAQAVSGPHAEAVRRGEVAQIEVDLA